MSITSDELNFLVYRYLQESGFVHSAFVFAYESLVGRSELATVDIPPGSLINFLQKGLQYVEIEKELEQHSKSGLSNGLSLLSGSLELASKKGEDAMDVDSGSKGGTTTMDLGGKISSGAGDAGWVSQADVTELKGHEDEVLACVWNPVRDVLASGSADSTARVWNIPRGASGLPASTSASQNALVLSSQGASEENSQQDSNNGGAGGSKREVVALDWSPDGDNLVSGSYDGVGRVWNKDGELAQTLRGHKGMLFSCQWSSSGSRLASCSVDKTAIVWDPSDGKIVQRFENHSAPVLDLDWKDDDTLATCSTDKTVCVQKVGQDEPVIKLQGHSEEVNAVRWSPDRSLLASCSDDGVAKLWRPDNDDDPLAYNLKDHSQAIYQVKWASSSTLATASFDTSIKIWDSETGKCVHSLTEHDKEVYSIDFSQDGKLLVSGSSDSTVRIWSVQEGKCVRKYRGGGHIFEVGWNHQGDKVAACFGLPGNCVSILDFRK